MKTYIAAALMSFASQAYAQISQQCFGDICYSLNIPQSTTNSNGDIFLQISAPASLEWAALGQGTGMGNAQIFVVYTSADGKNVTVSPRISTRRAMPSHNPDARISVLEGSGVVNGKMIANIRCSSCHSWGRGQMDFTANSASWIHASKTGSPLNTDDPSAPIGKHNVEEYGPFDWNFSQAKGGNSVNPFVTNSGDPVTGEPGRPPAGGVSNNNPGNAGNSAAAERERMRRILIAHGVLAASAFVLLFPVGAIVIRVLNFPSLLKLHAAIQIFAYVIFVIGFGMGAYLFSKMDASTVPIYHPVIGIIVFALVSLQPFAGQIHHIMYKKYNRRTAISHVHIWLGRILITLGMINGGLGLHWANNSRSGSIAYGVIAAIMWIAYIASAVLGEAKRSKKRPEGAKELRSLNSQP